MNTQEEIVIYKKSTIPDITPLPMDAPVKFFAPFIDVAIDRGVYRLKRLIQENPMSEEWVPFGWIDAGLRSQFVGIPIGYFRMIEGDVEFAPATSRTLKPHFAISFNKDWELVAQLSKQALIKGFDVKYQEKKAELLSKMVNVDPSK